jgi:hypothetical protein
MGALGVQIKGVLPWLVRWACRAGTRDFCPALAALVSPVQNITFFTALFFTILVPIAQQPGQAVVLGRLSLCLCWHQIPPPPKKKPSLKMQYWFSPYLFLLSVYFCSILASRRVGNGAKANVSKTVLVFFADSYSSLF